MNRVERDVCKESLVSVRADEPDRFPGNCVGQVFRFNQRRPVPHDRAVKRLWSFGGKKGMGTGQEAVKLIEASSPWMKLRLCSQMPFAKHSGDIAGLFQDISHRDDGWIEPTMQAMCDCTAGGIEFKTKSLLVPARHQPGTGGAARSRSHIGVRKTHALFTKCVNVRRGNLFRSVHRNVAVTKVIRKQQHNIRRTFVTGCDVGNAGKQFSFCSLAVRISRKDGDVGYFFGGRRVFASSTPFCVRLWCFFLSDKAISIGVHSFEQGRVLDFIGVKPSITVLICPGECSLWRASFR